MAEIQGAVVTDPAAELRGLTRSLERVGRLLEEPDEHLFARASSVSGWNTAEHLFHLILALDLSLRNVTALVSRRGRLVRDPVERVEEGLEVLRRGRIPRGTAEAPRFARPPKRFELSLVRDLYGEVRAVSEKLDVEAVSAAPRAIPHQVLGDLSAAEWLRFARMHTAHHLVIAREVLAHLVA